MLLVADNVINTYNYPNLLTAICKHALVFVVKVSRPCFSTRPHGVHEKFGVWGRDYHTLAMHRREGSCAKTLLVLRQGWG